MTTLIPIARDIWDMKYRLKGPDGRAVDATVEDTWARVAAALAEAEAPGKREAIRAEFLSAMRDFRVLPAGRVVAGAGSGRTVTLFNCFVMGTIPDDMGGIFEALKEAALTMQQGGGVGFDFSTLRPKGAPVRGVGADASGPISFMDVWDAMCRTIMSAGSRRGAMMATLRCDHPDIEDFIDAKRDPARLRMFNLSVLVTDAFMDAVRADKSWDLVFEGKVWRTVSARGLWDRITAATYEVAEPGVVFIDRVNALNNLHYCESISATNPCVTADTWVQTADGPVQVADLVTRPFTAIVNGERWESGAEGFFPTGVKPVLRLRTEEGFALRLTPDHRVQRIARLSRHARETEWVEARDLQPGDGIVLSDHRPQDRWGDPASCDQDDAEGYLLGLLIGDGTLKADKAVLSAWPAARAVNDGDAPQGVAAVMTAAEAAARRLPHRADFSGWMEVEGRGEWRLATAALRNLALAHDLAPSRKTLTAAMERRSAAFHEGALRGLFDSDGSVQGTQAKGLSIRLAQSDADLLRAAQRMLARLGIVSRIYENRREAGPRALPDGKGGTRLYQTAAQHELVIAGGNIARFAERIGFADTDKRARLSNGLAAYRRDLNRERFVATVAALEPDGEEAVYDASVPGVNAFDANGILAHNCGEQPLPPYGACLLGSLNLAALVKEPFTANARIEDGELATLARTAVRMLDNVIDVSNFPLPQQAHEAKAKRRIGLGVTGLADAFAMCGTVYGAPEALALLRRWLGGIRRAAYLASADLAAEKGPFPLFDREPFLAGRNAARLPEDVRAAIAAKGLRNGLITSIAPTGTISLFAGNVSSGIEPIFARDYARNVLQPDGTTHRENVQDFAYAAWRRLKGDAPLPAAFVTAQSLPPEAHLAVQAAAQEFIDSAISKTINVPRAISFDDFKDVYRKAYESGCKGCTTYRPNDVTGAVLSAEPAPAEAVPEPSRAPHPEGGAGVVYMTKPLDRPGALPGSTYKIKWPDSDHALYITLNDIVQDGRRRPFEIFINSKNMEHYAWTVALTRMMSAVFRRGGDVSFVVEELKAVFDPRGGQWMEGRYVPSLLAAIGDVIERHLVEIGFMVKPDEAAVARRRLAMGDPAGERGRPCPRCGAASLLRIEGCDTCYECGFSRCG